MITESLSSIPLPPAIDVKVEKNTKTEEPRAIEETDKSDDSRLDLEKQNISKKRSIENAENVDMELKTYTATNKESMEIPQEDVPKAEYEPIDLVV